MLISLVWEKVQFIVKIEAWLLLSDSLVDTTQPSRVGLRLVDDEIKVYFNFVTLSNILKIKQTR